MNLFIRAFVVLGVVAASASAQVPTTRHDFFVPGSQPGALNQPLRSAQWECAGCHGFYDTKKEPYQPWASSMMGQAARDPIFHACLTIANQDAAFVGDLCIRCHSPGGWLNGRADDPSGANLVDRDFEGVACSICHRLVNPAHQPGLDPARGKLASSFHGSAGCAADWPFATGLNSIQSKSATPLVTRNLRRFGPRFRRMASSLISCQVF